MANPTLLTSPIAENGDKNVIPASTGATTGLLDQEHGFQQINELPLQAGGLPPQRKDFNGAFNLLSGIDYMTQRGYTFEYDNTLPYVVGCIVIDPLDGKTYRCINDVPVGSANPSADATNWMYYDCLPLSGGVMTGSNATISKDDDLGFLQINGSPSQFGGASITLHGANGGRDGQLVLGSAKTVSNWASLLVELGGIFYRDNTLTESQPSWDIGGSAIVASSFGVNNGYIKFKQGHILQWARQYTASYPNIQRTDTITLPISFSSGNYGVVVSTTGGTSTTTNAMIGSRTASSVDIALNMSGLTVSGMYVYIFAFGN